MQRTHTTQCHPLLGDIKDFRRDSEETIVERRGEGSDRFSRNDFKEQDQRQEMSERSQSLQFPGLEKTTARTRPVAVA